MKSTASPPLCVCLWVLSLVLPAVSVIDKSTDILGWKWKIEESHSLESVEKDQTRLRALTFRAHTQSFQRENALPLFRNPECTKHCFSIRTTLNVLLNNYCLVLYRKKRDADRESQLLRRYCHNVLLLLSFYDLKKKKRCIRWNISGKHKKVSCGKVPNEYKNSIV